MLFIPFLSHADVIFMTSIPNRIVPTYRAGHHRYSCLYKVQSTCGPLSECTNIRLINMVDKRGVIFLVILVAAPAFATDGNNNGNNNDNGNSNGNQDNDMDEDKAKKLAEKLFPSRTAE